MSRLRLAYGGIIVLILAQSAYFYPKLPDTIGSHYSVGGTPDAWSSKSAFFVLYAIAVILMLAIFTGIPRLIRRMPTSLINMPNKEYWLASERREQTLERFAREMNWFGVAVLVFLAAVFQLVFNANLPGSAGFATLAFAMALGAFAVFTIGWAARMVAAYRVPRPS